MLRRQLRRGLGSSTGESQHTAWATTSVMLAVLLGLQSERVFISTMIFVVDQSNRAELARNAILVVLAIALVAPLARLAGLRNAALVSALLLAGSRVVVQLAEDPELRWPIAAAGFVACGWLLVTLAHAGRQALALGLVLGLWLDLVSRAGFDSIDLPYMPTSLKDALTVALSAVLLVAVARSAGRLDVPGYGLRGSATLLAIGAGIGTFALVTGNLGILVARAGGSIRTALILLSIGPAIVLALWLTPIGRGRSWLRLAGGQTGAASLASVLGLAGLVAIARAESGDAVLSAALVLVSLCASYLIVIALAGPRGSASSSGIVSTTGFVTAGLLIHAGTVFLYFASSGSSVYSFVAFGVLAVTAVAATWRQAVPGVPRLRGAVAPAAAVLVAFVAALVAAGGGSRTTEPAALGAEVTVVTYNIQNGFSRDNRWSLEATATTIESLNPDVVMLQEVGRGWFGLGWADQAGWLSRRLDMTLVFGGASADDLWGNAILSRAPLSEDEVFKYTSTQNLRRGVVTATVSAAGGELWVASTHLDNPADAEQVRIDQVTQLVDVWAGVQPAVIGGDFNMERDEDAIAIIESSGLVDAGFAVGSVDSTSESGKRIDYIFVTEDVEPLSFFVPDVWTSDHRPVATTLRLADTPARRG